MAGENGPSPGALSALDALGREPWRFDPFEALRRVECAYPQRPRLGRAMRPQDEPVRLRQEPSLRFAPAPVERYERRGDGPDVLVQAFFGMFGPNGALPHHLTDYAAARVRWAKDPTFARFADVFHHRMTALLYRAWAGSRPTVDADRPDEDRFRAWLGALAGFSPSPATEPGRWPGDARLHFSGRFAAPARNPEGLEAILGDWLALPVRVEEYAAEWLELPPDVRLRLGTAFDGPGVDATGARLGVDAVLGAATWSCTHRFRIVVGPLDGATFESLLPDGERLGPLADAVHRYVGDELAWELRLVVLAADRHPAALGGGGRLGWNTWLAPADDAPGEVTLRLRP